MLYKKITLLLLAVMMVNLPACTAYREYVENKQQNWCELSDWYEVGYRDGSKGGSLDLFTKHTEICRKFSITPNQKLWEQGRIAGIDTQYCTEQQVRNFAKANRNFNYSLCSVDKQRTLRDIYKDEEKRIEIEKLLSEKEKSLKEVEHRLKTLNQESDANNRYANELKRELEKKRRDLAYDIFYIREKNGMCDSSASKELCRYYERISRGW